MIIGREKEQARERERDKERKKRGHRKYGQAKLRHSKKGIESLMIAIVNGVIFVALILTAFLHKGQSDAISGSFGLFTIILTVMGLVVGLKGFRERNKNYVTCKFGVGINGVVLLALVVLFVRGIV